MQLKEMIRRLIIPQLPGTQPEIEPGLYHYMQEAGGMYTRFHLRVEPDGRGLLLANASASAHLSQTGVLIAKELLEGVDQGQVLRDLAAGYRGASRETMLKDVERIDRLIRRLGNPEDNYPITNLEDAAVSPYEAQLIAPLEANIPLASPDKLLPIIDRLWEVAIPHVTLLVPENPNGEYLVRAVERAEDLGLIAGVRGRATDLSQDNLLKELAVAGVDHVTVVYASADSAVHDVLLGEGDHALVAQVVRAIHDNEVASVIEIPLIQQTVDRLEETLASLQILDVHNYSFFAISTAEGNIDPSSKSGPLLAAALPQTAAHVEELAGQMDVRFIWQPPVERDPTLSMAEQVQQGPRCSGDVSVRIEPDGEVIPPRGPYQSAGNIINHEWIRIWNNHAFRNYRERVQSPTRCDECPGLAICAADCPRKPEGWALAEEQLS
ncbi:MAG: SPASM domain-containing protein [Candidatus Promineifilaceae bacterium]